MDHLSDPYAPVGSLEDANLRIAALLKVQEDLWEAFIRSQDDLQTSLGLLKRAMGPYIDARGEWTRLKYRGSWRFFARNLLLERGLVGKR